MTPFVRGSKTSLAAAVSKVETAAGDEARVYDYLKSRGELGATDHETSAALCMLPDTVRARRVALREKGLVMDSGLRRITPSNRMATVWAIGLDGGNLDAGSAPRVLRPSIEELRVAIENIRALTDHAYRTKGPPIAEELQQMGRWLIWISRPNPEVQR